MSLLISSEARDRLRLRSEPWLTPGRVQLPDVRAARVLALRLNEELERSGGGAAVVTAGTVNALALVEDCLQVLAKRHLETRGRVLLQQALAHLEQRHGRTRLDADLADFAREFFGVEPPGGAEPREPIEEVAPSRERLLLELLILWVQHINPAAVGITSMLHDGPLLRRREFHRTVETLSAFVATRAPEAGEGEETLWDILLGPQRASPDSLLGQLQFLQRRWGRLLADRAVSLQLALDLFAEELAPRFGGGPGPAAAPSLAFDLDEAVRYSVDLHWMPNLVLLAKNVYVWLDQLSRQRGRHLRRLDEIPDDELARVAARGFTGLWLIGIWERSAASRRIKQMCGNPEAEASAYSLRRYAIAEELGGEEALQRLKLRAREHGIRLAADMVPNHMGIDSDWVLDHPDWFLGDAECPFPVYSFNGPDLSPRGPVGIYLEDHYYDRSDAAVVFKRVERPSGQVRYIYHGNDGTSMPWNDTAQLDYLQPAVREAVLKTIVDVAKRFPVIRFDAAMTLAKRHYQRLWFPEPGSGGAIPSRAARGISREDFHRRMPEEFWRQVVDRVASEAPDTLLLAEAFWLMEGYFVRTLGMHRVYNSAFMNMLRDQQNDKYRRLLKETLEFDPRILLRYVNFMSNPDEQTAIEQFGNDDRYFGVCLLMATLPGLPMFAHGQFEGFFEKYGMEYRRAYWEEHPDPHLVARHEREIVPLLRRRELFAGVECFRLFDVVDDGGAVNEDVFAFVNGKGRERLLVLFNNRYRHARGRIREAAPVANHPDDGDAGPLLRETLTEALGLPVDGPLLIKAREILTGEEFLFDSRLLAERGLEIDLGAFHYRVFGGFETVQETDDRLYGRLAERLAGGGVPSIELARRALQLEPLRRTWDNRVHPALAALWSAGRAEQPTPSPAGREAAARLAAATSELAAEAARLSGGVFDDTLVRTAAAELEILGRFSENLKGRASAGGGEVGAVLRGAPGLRRGALAWVVLKAAASSLGDEFSAVSLAEPWCLLPQLERWLLELGLERQECERVLASLGCGLELGWGRRPQPPATAAEFLGLLLHGERTRQALHVHSLHGVEYLNREALETLLRWRVVLEAVAWGLEPDDRGRETGDAPGRWLGRVEEIERAAEAAGYRTDQLRGRLEEASGVGPSAGGDAEQPEG